MEEEKPNSYLSLFFIVFVIIIILFLQFVHKDFSLIIPEHNKKIILIYDTPSKVEIDVFQDSLMNQLPDSTYSNVDTAKVDSLNIQVNVLENPEIVPVVETENPDSVYFSLLVKEFGIKEKEGKGKPVIRYYTKVLDGKVVFDLEQYGYYVHERASIGLGGYSSNAIFYGDSIKAKDLQFIAYMLISKGLEIKEISPSKYKWKYNALEIGTDTTIMNNPNIQISELKNLLSRP